MALIIALLGVFGPALSLLLQEMVDRWIDRLPPKEREAALREIKSVAGRCLTKTRCEATGTATYLARVTEWEAIEAFARLSAKYERRVAALQADTKGRIA